jgi:hypothetical protein
MRYRICLSVTLILALSIYASAQNTSKILEVLIASEIVIDARDPEKAVDIAIPAIYASDGNPVTIVPIEVSTGGQRKPSSASRVDCHWALPRAHWRCVLSN